MKTGSGLVVVFLNCLYLAEREKKVKVRELCKNFGKNVNNQLQRVNTKFSETSVIILGFYRQDIIF